MVVKQALAHLRVADVWPAPKDRAIAEAEALDLAGQLTPGAVPAVLDRDPERCALVVDRAPVGWQDWKSLLLAGTVNEEVAARLGSLLSAVAQRHASRSYALRSPQAARALRGSTRRPLLPHRGPAPAGDS